MNAGAEGIRDRSGMKSNNKQLKCNLCGSRDLKLMFKGNIDLASLDRFSQYALHGDIYRCLSCEFVIQDVVHEIDEIVELLRSEKYLDEAIGILNLEEKPDFFKLHIDYMRRQCRLDGAAVLDVGANTGIFLNEMKAYSQSLQGIEPSTEAAETARTNFGHDVQNAVIADADLENDSFDIITMWDVIEHLYDPRGDLARLLPKLKPGGKIFISTHDVDGLFAKIMGKRYPMFMYQHFFHFSKKTLTRMMENAGFRVMETSTFYKSWNFGYLYYLLEKLWPESDMAKVAQEILHPLMRVETIRKLKIIIPIRNFFVIVAERPVEN